jgi:translation initiation factor 5B
LLDKIRGSAVASREVGMMTQHIGASFFPIQTLKEICGPLSKGFTKKINISGLLVVDTPGHNVFMNLRRRGGSVADISILVIDVMKGFEAQTHESLSILRGRKTPFLVAANKLDLIPGWKKNPNISFIESYNKQNIEIQRQLDEQLYIIIGAFSRLGIKADRFDKIVDFTKTVAIIPVSAKTGEGLPELLAILIGLTQQFMQEKLLVTQGPGKGTVLEVKEETGLGLTLNVILYDGIIRKGETIVIGGKEGAVVTKIRAILLPKPLDEIRDPREKFTPVERVSAASGIKISAPNIEGIIAGAPLYVVGKKQPIERLLVQANEEIEKLRIATDKIGVILKTDTLGSLEAITTELENNGIPVRLADVGDVSRREIVEAATIGKTASLYGVVLAFNVKILPDAKDEAATLNVPLFQDVVVYRLIDEYKDWVEERKKEAVKKALDKLILPGSIRVIPGFVFRKSQPAIFGVEVLKGRIKQGYSLVREDGGSIGAILQIQDKGENINQAITGMKVALSMREPTIGRHFTEDDTLYVAVPEEDSRILLKKYQNVLSIDEIQTLKELIEIMRKKDSLWGL